MSDNDLADVQMEGFESLQSGHKKTPIVDDSMGSHIAEDDDDYIEPSSPEPVVNRKQEQAKEERRE